MYCMNCGRELRDDAKYCDKCMTEVGTLPSRTDSQASKSPSKAKAVSQSQDYSSPNAASELRNETTSHMSNSPSVQQGSQNLKSHTSSRRNDVSEILSQQREAERKKYSRVLGVANIILALIAFLPWISLDLYIYADSYTLFGFFPAVSSFNSTLSSLTGNTSYGLSGTVSLFGMVAIVLFLAMLILNVYDAYLRFKDGLGSARGYISSLVGSLVVVVAVFVFNAAYGSGDIIALTIWPWVCCIGSLIMLIAKGVLRDKLVRGEI